MTSFKDKEKEIRNFIGVHTTTEGIIIEENRIDLWLWLNDNDISCSVIFQKNLNLKMSITYEESIQLLADEIIFLGKLIEFLKSLGFGKGE